MDNFPNGTEAACHGRCASQGGRCARRRRGSGLSHPTKTWKPPAAFSVWSDLAVGQNPVPLVNIKIGGKWMFIHPKMEPQVMPHGHLLFLAPKPPNQSVERLALLGMPVLKAALSGLLDGAQDQIQLLTFVLGFADKGQSLGCPKACKQKPIGPKCAFSSKRVLYQARFFFFFGIRMRHHLFAGLSV